VCLWMGVANVLRRIEHKGTVSSLQVCCMLTARSRTL
jgi:hypothetical protein